MAWAEATAGWGNPLANLCLPFLLALGITIWNGSLYIIKCFPGILDCGIGRIERIWEYISQTPVVPCSFLDLHGEGMLEHGQWAVIMAWNGNTKSYQVILTQLHHPGNKSNLAMAGVGHTKTLTNYPYYLSNENFFINDSRFIHKKEAV